jgi:hypothetical protein
LKSVFYFLLPLGWNPIAGPAWPRLVLLRGLLLRPSIGPPAKSPTRVTLRRWNVVAGARQPAAPRSSLATRSHLCATSCLVTPSRAPRACADLASTYKSWRLQSEEMKPWCNQNRAKFITYPSGSLIRLEMRITMKSRICTTSFPYK